MQGNPETEPQSAGIPVADVPTWPLYTVLWAAVLLATINLQLDPDLWGHVKFGLDFIKSGAIYHADPYSYLTVGSPWIDHEWLCEIIFGKAFQRGGTAGLLVLRLAIIFAIFALLSTNLHRWRIPLLASGMIFLSVLIELNPGVACLRPQLFTYLCFAIELLLLQKLDIQGKQLQLWLLPPLFALWINLHGGILAGLAVLFFFSGIKFVLSSLQQRNIFKALKDNCTLLIVCPLCLLATLATPYGADLLPFLLKTATVSRSEISEWQPLHLVSQMGLIWSISTLYALWASWAFFFKKHPASNCVMLLCLLLPWSAERHVPLAALAVALLPLPDLAVYFTHHQKLCKIFSLPNTGGRNNAAITALLLASSLLLVGLAISRMSTVGLEQNMPVQAVSLLRQSGVKGNIICYFDWGEYCIWHLYPDLKVSIDGRRETVYTPVVYQQNLDFTYGGANEKRLLTNENPSMVLINRFTSSYAIIKAQPDWRLVYEDQIAALFARQNSPQEIAILNELRKKPQLQPGKANQFP